MKKWIFLFAAVLIFILSLFFGKNAPWLFFAAIIASTVACIASFTEANVKTIGGGIIIACVAFGVTVNIGGFRLSEFGSYPEPSIGEMIKIPENFKPVYKIIDVSRLDDRRALRTRIRMTVPKGLKRKPLLNNIRHAVKISYQRRPVDAISVALFTEGQDIGNAPDVGNAVFAPSGRWEKADHALSLINFRLTFKLNKTYFTPPTPYP